MPIYQWNFEDTSPTPTPTWSLSSQFALHGIPILGWPERTPTPLVGSLRGTSYVATTQALYALPSPDDPDQYSALSLRFAAPGVLTIELPPRPSSPTFHFRFTTLPPSDPTSPDPDPSSGRPYVVLEGVEYPSTLFLGPTDRLLIETWGVPQGLPIDAYSLNTLPSPGSLLLTFVALLSLTVRRRI